MAINFVDGKYVDANGRVKLDPTIYKDWQIAEEAEKIGLEIVPFDAGFFVSVPCDNADEIAKKLEAEGLFILPLKKGLRISVASISEAACRKIPAMIKKYM